MKITGVTVVPFETTIDHFANGVAHPDAKIIQPVTKVETDDGVEGFFFGGHFHSDRDGLLAEERALINEYVSPCSSDWIRYIERRSQRHQPRCGHPASPAFRSETPCPTRQVGHNP